MALCDAVTVMRGGAGGARLRHRRHQPRRPGRGDGRPPRPPRPRSAARGAPQPGAVLLRAAACTGATRSACRGWPTSRWTLRAGEIVGVAGVSGNGQSELLDVLSGLLVPQAGRLRARRRDASRRRTGSTPRTHASLRIAHVPEDRHRRGLVLPFAAWESAVLGYQQRPRYDRRGWLRQPAMRADCADDDGALRRAPARPALRSVQVLRRQPAEAGAGARGLRPSRACCWSASRRAASTSAPSSSSTAACARCATPAARCCVVSSELDEILALADRVLVMNGGRIAGELPIEQCSEAALGRLMGGADAAKAA